MARKTANDDPLAPVTLAVGQEDLLLDRAVREVVAAARAADADTDVRDLAPDQLQPGTLAELTSPSLFAERKVVVVRDAQDLSADTIKDVKAYLGAPAEEITLVLLHAGGAKGKGLLDAARKAGAREVACPKMTKPADRLAFVRGEFRTLGRSATPEACQALVDAIGSDLRELASAVSQLVADVEGTIDEAVVGRYYTGRAEASSFDGRRPGRRGAGGRGAGGAALVPGDRGRARADHQRAGPGGAGHRQAVLRARAARPADLARELGMPPWKIDRVRQQMRGWTPDGVAAGAAGGGRGRRGGQGRRRRPRVRAGEGGRDDRAGGSVPAEVGSQASAGVARPCQHPWPGRAAARLLAPQWPSAPSGPSGPAARARSRPSPRLRSSAEAP